MSPTDDARSAEPEAKKSPYWFSSDGSAVGNGTLPCDKCAFEYHTRCGTLGCACECMLEIHNEC